MSRTPTQILDDCCTELNAKGQAHISGLLQHVKQFYIAVSAERDIAERALLRANYTRLNGTAEWKPPLGPTASPLLDTISRLTEALKTIADGDEPRPLGKRYRRDGEPSKHDKCTHGQWMWEDCGSCVTEFARAALGTPADSDAVS